MLHCERGSGLANSVNYSHTAGNAVSEKVLLVRHKFIFERVEHRFNPLFIGIHLQALQSEREYVFSAFVVQPLDLGLCFQLLKTVSAIPVSYTHLTLPTTPYV